MCNFTKVEKRKILFVINPSAGKKKKINIERFIKGNFSFHDYTAMLSSSLLEFENIKKKIVEEHYTDVIACGGDGTVNKTASFAYENKLKLGILPLGSGNGLARSLGISMNLKTALKQVETGKTKVIDGGSLNNKLFFCAAGIGFDAHISSLFEKAHKRGLWGYIQLIMKEFFSYKAQTYTLRLNGLSISRNAFMIACCNSGQYGNDFYVAPTASMHDGKITISLLKPFKWVSVPHILFQSLRKKAHRLKQIETFHAEEITIRRNKAGHVHIDGEPFETGMEIKLKAIPNALEIIC